MITEFKMRIFLCELLILFPSPNYYYKSETIPLFKFYTIKGNLLLDISSTKSIYLYTLEICHNFSDIPQ